MTFNHNKIYISILCIAVALLSACEADDPVKEDVPEMITQVNLIFTPADGGAPVTATAIDPDGEGVQDIQVDGPVNLSADTEYILDIELVNGLAEPGTAEYNVTDEVSEEAEEHLFFFSWTDNLFSDPSGNGNVDNRNDPVNYEDEDADGQPLGLKTAWTTGEATTGELRIILKHQPGLKSANSDANTGETDLDIRFPLIID